ncbi:hypothetical protein G6F60_015434 [Rhizopus arrhizus]|nr:hypothetical protein G6F60_015434 [Rhizopus arrhizus]
MTAAKGFRAAARTARASRAPSGSKSVLVNTIRCAAPNWAMASSISANASGSRAQSSVQTTVSRRPRRASSGSASEAIMGPGRDKPLHSRMTRCKGPSPSGRGASSSALKV